MDCTIAAGTPIPCGNSGGNYELYLATKVVGFKATADATSTKITDIDSDGSATALVFYKFNLVNGTLKRSEPIASEGGSKGFNKTLEFTVAQMSQENKILLNPIIQGESVAVLKDKNNKWFLMGEFEALRIVSGEIGSGAAITDVNGYPVVLGSDEGELSNEIVSTAIVPDGTGVSLTVSTV